VKYLKGEGECEKLFLTNNLMNGLIQRLEHFRKYAFAVHGVYGEEPALEIRGVWVWRGVGIPAEIKELDSFDCYTWTKLDMNVEGDKKLLSEYWNGLEDDAIVEGLRAREVKYFK
jgi:elongation factor 1-gamma